MRVCAFGRNFVVIANFFRYILIYCTDHQYKMNDSIANRPFSGATKKKAQLTLSVVLFFLFTFTSDLFLDNR